MSCVTEMSELLIVIKLGSTHTGNIRSVAFIHSAFAMIEKMYELLSILSNVYVTSLLRLSFASYINGAGIINSGVREFSVSFLDSEIGL